MCLIKYLQNGDLVLAYLDNSNILFHLFQVGYLSFLQNKKNKNE